MPEKYTDKSGDECIKTAHSKLCRDKDKKTYYVFEDFNAEPTVGDLEHINIHGTESEIYEIINSLQKQNLLHKMWLDEAKEAFTYISKPRKILTCNDIDFFMNDEKEASEKYADFEENKLSKDEYNHYQYWIKKSKEHKCYQKK